MNNIILIELALVALMISMFFVVKAVIKIFDEVVGNHLYDKEMWNLMERWTIRTDKAILNMRKRDENMLRRLGQVLDEQGNHCDDIQSCIDNVESKVVQVAKKTATLENCTNQIKNEVLVINSLQTQLMKMEKEGGKVLKMVEINMEKVKNKK